MQGCKAARGDRADTRYGANVQRQIAETGAAIARAQWRERNKRQSRNHARRRLRTCKLQTPPLVDAERGDCPRAGA
eukprot:11218046-Lingulodinium_polyedra.AAC.1